MRLLLVEDTADGLLDLAVIARYSSGNAAGVAREAQLCARNR
jgi:hypothetical protein